MPKRVTRAELPVLRVCWASSGPVVETADASEERIRMLRKLFEGR